MYKIKHKHTKHTTIQNITKRIRKNAISETAIYTANSHTYSKQPYIQQTAIDTANSHTYSKQPYIQQTAI
jgi:hypothetical protein